MNPELLASPTLLKRTVQQLKERLENVKLVSDPSVLSEKIEELEAKASATEFWQDRASAERVLIDLKDLKEDLRVIKEMEMALEDIECGYEMLSETDMQDEELAPFQARPFLAGMRDRALIDRKR